MKWRHGSPFDTIGDDIFADSGDLFDFSVLAPGTAGPSANAASYATHLFGHSVLADPLPDPMPSIALSGLSDAASAGGPTVDLNTTQAGQQITRDNLHWGTTLGLPAGPITFGFHTSAPTFSVSGENVQGTFTPLTASEQAAVRAALALWGSVANITFTDLGNSNNATIEFSNYSSSTDNSEAFAFFPGSTAAGNSAGDVFINTHYASTTNDGPGTYDFMTFIHEIGHTLGLEHPGDYNAGPGQTITYASNAEYIEDTRQYSLMSYFDESNTGGSYTVFDETPMLDDIAAIQRLYGANANTRTSDTTYGFHSNAGSPYSITSASQHVVFSIYDAGGNDTLDFSGYSQAQTINLNAESFSSVGGDIYNVSIAQGVSIENAIGGAGSDTIIGNGAGNFITGGPGNDTIDGGAGIDTAIFSGLRSAYTITDLGNGSVRVSGPDGTDTLTNVERLQFSDQTISSFVAPPPPANLWHVIDAADVSGDGHGDMIWQNDDGQAGVWLLNGATIITQTNVGGNFGSSWHIEGAGDFNGDGRADFLWQNDNGQAGVWLLNGVSIIAQANVAANPGPAWHALDAGDFNGDGKADILWQNDNGQAGVWLMDGVNQIAQANVGGNPGSSWHAIAAGDFDGDHKADILWQNDNGQAGIWLMNGLNQVAQANVGGNPGPAWHVKALGDFNGDGHADILWQNDNGQAGIWLMNGMSVLAQTNVGANFGPAWHAIAAADFNGDGKADILWQNDNGQAGVWLMNGTTPILQTEVGLNPDTLLH